MATTRNIDYRYGNHNMAAIVTVYSPPKGCGTAPMTNDGAIKNVIYC